MPKPIRKTARHKTAKREWKPWGGPMVDGISFSSLSKFLCCRERFRLYKVEGLVERPEFNFKIEFGTKYEK